MITSLSAATVIALALGLVIGLIVLLVLQVITGMRVQRLTQPLYEYARSQSQAEADHIVNEAHEAARTMMAQAQQSVSALIEKQRVDIEAHAQTYQKSLEELATAAKHSMTESSEKAHSAQAELSISIAHEIEAQGAELKTRMERVQQELDNFFKQSQAEMADMRRGMEESTHTLAESFKKAFDDVSGKGEKRIDERIDQLLAAAQAEVAEYQKARKRLVDEHMADLITETSKVVLRKTLTPDEHAELVDNALKEARTAGII
ncbi:MAG: hypothetical protein JWM46_276 [Candidatus Kaiserbacteria bacterium]|nr:hypothetical protein [Candidatus Kaiserbacteria bacterium]